MKTPGCINCILISLTSLFSSTLYAQTNQTVLFIEPNVSLHYDSTRLYREQLFSHSSYKKEVYSFSYHDAVISKAAIEIIADYSMRKPDLEAQDKFFRYVAQSLKKNGNDSMEIMKVGEVYHCNGFSCFGTLMRSKKDKKGMVLFKCTKLFDEGTCDVQYVSKKDKYTTSYSNDSLVVTSLLNNLQTLSQKECDSVRESIVKNISLRLDTSNRVMDPYFKPTYTGMLNIKGIPPYAIKEAHIPETVLEAGYIVMKPEDDGNIFIYASDQLKGRIVKQCELVVISSIGKEIKVPFELSYENR